MTNRWRVVGVAAVSRPRPEKLMGTMLILVVVVVGLVAQLPTIQVHGLTATVLELDPTRVPDQTRLGWGTRRNC